MVPTYNTKEGNNRTNRERKETIKILGRKKDHNYAIGLT
jgi:hypothetical protein